MFPVSQQFHTLMAADARKVFGRVVVLELDKGHMPPISGQVVCPSCDLTFNRGRDNHTCQLCNATHGGVSYGKSTMCVHHIDYNKRNCEETNLITLCNRCNSKVNSGREHWQRYFSLLAASREEGRSCVSS